VALAAEQDVMAATSAERARARLPRWRRALTATGGRALSLLGLLVSGLALADTDVLARVGAIAIDVPAFQKRAALVAAVDWATLGASWPEQRRRLLDDVLIPEALLAQDLPASPGPPTARARALALALEAELRRQASAPAGAAELAAYADRYRRELSTPRALTLWRILVPSEADARALIARLTPPTEAAFSQLARDGSIDLATRMRAGNLGRVFADGDTAVPELRVSPVLFAAAERVGDGELVPEPVAEGSAFAVLWRRASHPERMLPAGDVARLADTRLGDERFARQSAELLAGLRSKELVDYHPERVAGYAPRFEEPPTGARRWALPREAERGAVRLAPEPTDRGLR
jgi:peptidyl-prolyl cis-trans isomerase C